MKKLLLFVTVCISGISFSQPATKLDFYLASKLAGFSTEKKEANNMLPMLIQGNIGAIKQLVSKNGGVFKYSYSNIAAIIIPESALSAFNESKYVSRMEGGPHHYRILDDSSNIKNHITEVLNGDTPLPNPYNGKGVVMGFIDTGIDYLHPDFRDSSGTRIKYYWDQNRFTNQYTPQPYAYGQAWNKRQIDSLQKANVFDSASMDSASIIYNGHGTYVAGVACGNGSCNGKQFGGCPKSDIICVAVSFTSTSATLVTDAVNYIYTCADSLNEPCVINISLGEYDGSHDDSDLQGEMIDAMILAKQPGRAMAVAIGDDGYPYHLHDSLYGNTNFTWFYYDNGLGYTDIPLYSNKSDFNNVKFRLRCDKVQTGSYTERDTLTVYSSIASFIGFKSFNIYNSSGQRLAQVQSEGQVYGTASYSLEFRIYPDSTSYYFGFQSTGTGRFDAWDYGTIIGIVDSTGLKINQTNYPEMSNYKQPDSTMTLCSSYQCSPNVLTTQTYFNLLRLKNCLSTALHDSMTTNPNSLDTPGEFVWGISKGPTRNYVHVKPDVSACGNYTLSAYPTWWKTCNTITDSLSCHAVSGGTSLASPMVASAAALYMERFPNMTNANLISCIDANAYNDAFTGPPSNLPNNNWGYGKLDAFNALTMCSTTNVPLVVISNLFNISAYPNPYTSNTVISYDFSVMKNYNNASIVVFDMFGKMVRTISLKSSQGNVTLDRQNMASGMYFYSLMVDGSRLKTEKLEVM